LLIRLTPKTARGFCGFSTGVSFGKWAHLKEMQPVEIKSRAAIDRSCTKKKGGVYRDRKREGNHQWLWLRARAPFGF
jgi:hypothetical protein